MTLPKLLLSPLVQGYGYQPQNEVISISLDGGSPRKRREKIGAYGSVSCTFVLSSVQYRYLMSFYRTKTKNGSLPFLMDIKTDDAELQEHECYFKEDTLKLTSTRADLFFVSVQLEAKPLIRDETEDNLMVDLYTEYGDNLDDFLNLLGELVNVTLPGAL